MRRHTMLLTVIAALVLVGVCIAILRFSDVLLPDYRNKTEEITLPDNPTMLMVNDREAADLWPWDIYKSGPVYPVDSAEAAYVYPDKRVAELVSILSPWMTGADLDQVEWTRHLEYTDNNDDGVICFLKDITIADAIGETYLVNIAFRDQYLIYYSCDRLDSAASDTAEDDTVSYGYDRLNRDYDEFVRYGADAAADGYAESEADTYDLMTVDNSFMLFMQKLSVLDDSEEEWSGTSFAYTEMFREMAGNGTGAGMVYRHSDDTPDVVNVEFRLYDFRMVIFYDLYLCEVTGFSFEG